MVKWCSNYGTFLETSWQIVHWNIDLENVGDWTSIYDSISKVDLNYLNMCQIWKKLNYRGIQFNIQPTLCILPLKCRCNFSLRMGLLFWKGVGWCYNRKYVFIIMLNEALKGNLGMTFNISFSSFHWLVAKNPIQFSQLTMLS